MTTAVAEPNGKTVEPKPLTIRDRLNSPDFSMQIARVLPSHMNAERMCRVALTALTRTPKLADCDQASFFRCLLDLSQWGLEPDGRRAHLIPFENRKRGVTECQLIVDYKGIVELCFRTGTVTAIHADVVRTGDIFKFSCGHVTEHTPWFLRDRSDRPSKQGDIFAVYCVVTMKGGMAKHEVMSVEDIEGIRKRSRAGSSGPWVTDWSEMAKKTVFRRCSKWLPWSAEIIDAIEKDDDLPESVQRETVSVQRIAPLSLESLTAQYDEQPAETTVADAGDATETEGGAQDG